MAFQYIVASAGGAGCHHAPVPKATFPYATITGDYRLLAADIGEGCLQVQHGMVGLLPQNEVLRFLGAHGVELQRPDSWQVQQGLQRRIGRQALWVRFCYLRIRFANSFPCGQVAWEGGWIGGW